MTDLEKNILTYLKPFNPEKIGFFGSYARRENLPGSDIDILIKFKETLSLFQLIKIENELSEITGTHIDLVTEESITNKRILKSIMNDLQIIYHA